MQNLRLSLEITRVAVFDMGKQNSTLFVFFFHFYHKNNIKQVEITNPRMSDLHFAAYSCPFYRF